MGKLLKGCDNNRNGWNKNFLSFSSGERQFNYYIFADVNAKIPIAGFMNKKAAYDFLYTCKSGAICIAKIFLDD